MAAFARRFEGVLESLLSGEAVEGEIIRPARLVAAMRHGALDGGKRLRPFLLMESARLFGEPGDALMRVGTALECIHCYSLIHDDLPAMDDDDMRRGRPTVHKAFDEATAILAGDGLLTLAFDIIADPATALPDPIRVALVLELARASGLGGMAGGQALDLEAERDAPDEAGIIRLQAMKTGALLRFAARGGAIAMGASPDAVARLTRYGEITGLAFQIADDLLDLTADAATMGKATGKDAARGKGTLVSLHGPDWARARLAQLEAEAAATLAPFGAKAARLNALAAFIGSRPS
ncbi:MAG: polyprenyl synthetase family protein [Rhizobiaceae bacterium]|jgi:farnesyl diphosphate synthase|nr:polyprenyl synthetase family protein [Rhizobiaceae bacterium]